MIKQGLKKIRRDHRDRDLHKSFGMATTSSLPTDFTVDAGLWMPNQDIPQAITGLDTIPALPYGCTDYTQVDLCADEDNKLYSPMVLENITHANQNNGTDIRVALEAAKQALGRTGYYSVKAQGILDWFDAIRLAIYSGQPEKRSVSIGIPWFPEFERLPAGAIMPIPIFDTAKASWHNAKVAGWKTIHGTPYLMIKSWQGPGYGDNGWCYMSRELCNALLNIRGTGAFTLTKMTSSTIQTVDMGLIATIVSFIRNKLGF